MINKDMLIEYFKIIYGYGADSNLTLVDFSLNDEQRKIVNIVNDEAKKDKNLANLLEDLKYSNNKTKIIEEYFDKQNEEKNNTVKNINTRIDNYGFINTTNLISIIAITMIVLVLVITFGSK